MTNRLLSTKDAARFLGVSATFLERDRCYDAEIPFVRVGARAVRYEIDALEAFVRSHIRKSTSDRGS